MAELFDRLQAAVGDNYRLIEELGGGGMSRVFLALEVELDRRVVIKVLPPDMTAGVNRERFHREVQLAARLQHPHVVPLLTAGAADGLLYYVMPYIDGESLRTKLNREGELPVGEAVRILKEVVDALSYAHRNGVVHRDIKPDNVLLSDGHAVVADFGVAKAVTASSGASSLTSLGVALGTPAYMAPEQAAADPHMDHRADIYAVGALAYEMLSGQPPFTGATPQAVMAAHVNQPAEPLTQRRPAVSAALNALVMRCLEKRAADRWQTAAELVPQLEAMSTPSGGMTPTGTAPVPAVDYNAAARQAHPVRVGALFALASVGALAIVYLLVYQLGLPNWVFYGAIGLLVIGLPIMLLTGHHERQRALAYTTGVAVPTPTSGIRRWFTWQKSLLGGGVAFAGLAVLATGYMTMRNLGIGPVGTLVAAGVLEERDRIIVADFEDRTPEANLGTSVTELLRIDLTQSPVLRLMGASATGDVLRRMDRDPMTPLDVDLATEVGRREGVKAVLAGDIGTLGRGYVVSARLLSTADGSVLVGLRETADDDTKIIDAVDRLSAKLRERIGESLRTIRAGEPLEQVTTSSLAALETYSRAVKAGDHGDFERASGLLEETIAIDSTFAMAYRKLAVIFSNAGAPRSRINAAAAKAFENRMRLPDVERYLAEAYYYDNVNYDRAKVTSAYRSILEIDPYEATALNNLAVHLNSMRRWEEGEELAVRAIESEDVIVAYGNAAYAQLARGKIAEARATLERMTEGAPSSPWTIFFQGMLASGERDYAVADVYYDSLQATQRSSPSWTRAAAGLRASVAEIRGQLARAERQLRNSMAASEEEENHAAYISQATNWGWLDVFYRDAPEDGLRRVAAALERFPLGEIDPSDRPYLALAHFYANAGRPRVAGRLLAEYEEEVNDGLKAGDFFRHAARASVARAEGRVAEAIVEYRTFYDESGCAGCGLFELARTYDAAGQTDSALAVYERAVSNPGMFRLVDEYRTLAQTYKRLGEIYEERGATDEAIEYYNKFVDLWQDADEELQPIVRDIRNRIARLAGEPRDGG